LLAKVKKALANIKQIKQIEIMKTKNNEVISEEQKKGYMDGYTDGYNEGASLIKNNQIELLKEDFECIHIYLDDINIPRQDESGELYSLVGRVKYLEQNGF